MTTPVEPPELVIEAYGVVTPPEPPTPPTDEREDQP